MIRIFSYAYNVKQVYRSRFIPKGVAEASQIFLRDAHVLPNYQNYLAIKNTTDEIGGKPIAVCSQSISL
jgi:hypothetical protein